MVGPEAVKHGVAARAADRSFLRFMAVHPTVTGAEITIGEPTPRGAGALFEIPGAKELQVGGLEMLVAAVHLAGIPS